MAEKRNDDVAAVGTGTERGTGEVGTREMIEEGREEVARGLVGAGIKGGGEGKGKMRL